MPPFLIYSLRENIFIRKHVKFFILHAQSIYELKILMIDDNVEITNMMSKFLKLSGHDCTVSNDARNGLALIENQKFDTILLDVAMPEFSGYDVVEHLSKNDKLKENKIILFTASSVSNDKIDEMIKKGVHSCLRKPIGLDELLKSVEGR